MTPAFDACLSYQTVYLENNLRGLCNVALAWL